MVVQVRKRPDRCFSVLVPISNVLESHRISDQDGGEEFFRLFFMHSVDKLAIDAIGVNYGLFAAE